jgi:hypothetical protein
MPYQPKSSLDSFNTDWSKAVAWAQSQGIGPSSYLPVYQMDVTRIQNGETPMGGAERNLAIQAAHNPNQVLRLPTDNPDPSNVIGNTVSDVGKIATGIAGIFTGSFEKQFWHSAQTTFKGVIDPASLAGPQMGTTISNWLNKTLLGYVPGMADIGTILAADPTLSNAKGFEALAEHPLVSVLDLAGADSLGAGAIGKLASGEGIMGKLGETTGLGAAAAPYRAAVRDSGSLLEQLANVSSSRFGLGKLGVGKPGIAVRGVQATDAMSITDVLSNMAAKVPGVGPVIGDLMQNYAQAARTESQNAAWMFEPANKALEVLDDKQYAQVVAILDPRGNLDRGSAVLQALDDPKVDVAVKDALRAVTEGPLRHSIEDSIFGGGLHPTIVLDGRESIWVPTSKSFLKVNAARLARDAMHRVSVKAVTALAPFVTRLAQLDAMLPAALTEWDKRVTAVRQAVAEDAGLTGTIQRDLAKPTRFRQKAGISKSKPVAAVVGEGGLVDQFREQISTNKDPDQILVLARQMKRRLSGWGPDSVDRADSPALAGLYDAVAAFEEYATQYKENAGEIDRAIHGEIETQAELSRQHIEARDRKVKETKDRQAKEVADTKAVHDWRIAQLTDVFARRTAQLNESMTLALERIYRDGDAETARMTPEAADAVYKRIRNEERKIRNQTSAQLKSETQVYEARLGELKAKKREALTKLGKTHHSERVEMGKDIRTVKEGLGDLSKTLMEYGKTVDKYHQLVADTASDEYKDVFVALYEKHLLAHEHAAELIGQTERFMKDKVGMSAERIQKIRQDPRLLAEYMTAVFRGLYGQPDYTPEVAAMAQSAMRDARASANEELKEAIGRGLVVQYIPSATGFDERLGPGAFDPIVGRGIPKPDMEKMKLWEMTPKKEDFALGVTKATIQTFQRHAVIDLAEHYLSPMAMKASELNLFIAKHFLIEEGLEGGNLGHETQIIAARDLGMTAFDPHKLFGFSLPRWGSGETLYLPTSIVNALEKMNKDRGALWKVSAKSTKLFRYSILGLSPRYTAHVLFGGTMMLALRSSPLVFTFLPEAWKGIRDGTIPGMGHRAIEEGFEDTALRLRNEAQGQWAGTEMKAEHVEQRQGVSRAAAKPIHWLKAAADLNFRFTRYVRDLQFAVAYLDGAAKAERRSGKIALEDPDTGKTIYMSPDRAMKEGMHHAEQVFGNLDRMSPFERQVAQSVMPFYGWQKHILSYVMTFPFDHPWRALILSQMAFNASQSVPLGFPIRLQFLLNLGSPDAQGNVQPIDLRSLDPFRDVGNYASWTGVFESLNPALSAPLTMAFGQQAQYGEASLYPNVTYNQFYGIETAGSQGSLLTGIEQWLPQTGAADSAISAIAGIRSEWSTNRRGAITSMLENLGIPFATPPINLNQIAAKDSDARFEVAKTAAQNAFSTGDFSILKGYTTVPYPLNTAYEVTPAQLQAIYQQALESTPGVAPIESLLPPPTPSGY